VEMLSGNKFILLLAFITAKMNGLCQPGLEWLVFRAEK
jgi:hypothetical protein